MCGIAGFLNNSLHSGDEASNILASMSNAIIPRGPDSSGLWLSDDAQVGFSHRRLAIIELSEAGHQPMISESGRYVIVFNGEIYNHLDLRRDLADNCSWLGCSDTETLLAGFEAWGIENTLQRCIGMFAIAVWDQSNSILTLVRDRLGEKPLYYGWQGHGNQTSFLFGSDLSALRRHPAFEGDINRDAIALFMRYSCIGGAHSIYSGIYKLEPGHLLTVSIASRTPVIRSWWSGAEMAVQGVAEPFYGTPDQIVDDLESLLSNAIGLQMMADVPLGAFLSGGIDSSTVVALMQAQSSSPVRTFSIGFMEADYNEAEQARLVASHLRTDHTELYVTPQQALEVIPKLPSLYSEPFADPSQIPTFLVSQLARQQVTVSLSGDGGDELFCGYTRYQMTRKLWGKLSYLPYPLRRLLADLITSVPTSMLNKLGRLSTWSHLGTKLHKGALLLESGSAADLYKGMVSHWSDSTRIVRGSAEPTTVLTGSGPALPGLDDVERMMALDMLSYLPDDILAKVDRAAMGASLETRAPFLDHRVVKFAWSLPLAYKLRDGETKWPLRQVLYRHVPKALVDRGKMGFSVPLDSWLRGPLREWAEALLSESRLHAEGFLDPIPVRQKWVEHLTGQRNWQHHLWNVLMFQSWLEAQKKN